MDKDTLQDIIEDKVSIETTIYSDTWKAYQGLEEEFADHQTVNHSHQEYVRGQASINGIEGFWGYAKERLLRYHGVSPEHFVYYLKKIEFRFNHRSLNTTRICKAFAVCFSRKSLQQTLMPKLFLLYCSYRKAKKLIKIYGQELMLLISLSHTLKVFQGWVVLSLVVLLTGFINLSYSQPDSLHVLEGEVRNAVSGQPLENVHIFLDQSFFGTMSDENGTFRLSNIAGDYFNLVSSVDSFVTFSKAISVSDLQSKRLLIILYPSDEEKHESASELYPSEPEASMANSFWEQGIQLMENGLYEQALRGWEIISRHTDGQVPDLDPRIGFSYIEAVTGRQMRTRYKMASMMYEAALSNAENGRFRQAFEDEIERLKPIADRDQSNTWQRLLSEERLGELGRSMQTFWRMLDPTLSTTYNERLIEHWERMAYVKEQYGKEAWKRSDRAQLYLQYGAPDRIKTGRLNFSSAQFLYERVTGREKFREDVANIARQFDRRPSYELWIYEDLVPDNARNMVYMFGEDGDTGEFRRVDSLEELIPSSAFRQNSGDASIMFQLAYYDELSIYDSFFGQRFSDISRFLQAGGRDSGIPDANLSKMLKNRNEHQYRFRQRNVPDEQSTYTSDLPAIPLAVHQYRLLNEDNEPVLATFVESRPGKAYLIDQVVGGTFDPLAYCLVHGVRVAGEDRNVIYQSSEDALFQPGGENGPSATYFEIPHTPGGQQVFAAELHSPAQSSAPGDGQVFSEQVRGLGRYAAAQPSPLSTNPGELEVSDLIMGYDMGREEMHHPFGFRLSRDRRIPGGEDVAIHFEVYHLHPTSDKPGRFTVDYSLEPVRGFTERIFKGKEQRVSLTLNFETTETTFRDNLEIATSTLQPGEYTLSFTVTDSNTGQQKNQSVVFTVQ